MMIIIDHIRDSVWLYGDDHNKCWFWFANQVYTRKRSNSWNTATRLFRIRVPDYSFAWICERALLAADSVIDLDRIEIVEWFQQSWHEVNHLIITAYHQWYFNLMFNYLTVLFYYSSRRFQCSDLRSVKILIFESL